MKSFLRLLGVFACSAIVIAAGAQPAQRALRPPDITTATITMDTPAAADADTSPTARDWELVELSVLPGDNVRTGPGAGHWSCTPGAVNVRLDVPARIRSQVAGVVFWSRWVNSTVESPITFHTERFRKSRGGEIAARPGSRDQRSFQQRREIGQSADQSRARRPMQVDAAFTAPVHGEYQLYVEIVDHNGARHLSPTIMLHCGKELPPEPKAQPVTDTMPRRP